MRERRTAAASVEIAAGHENMLQLVELRWLAVIGQVITIYVVSVVLGIALPLPQMLTVLGCLVIFNLFCQLRWREPREVANSELFLALLVDVASLTAQLYFSGGTANPFAFLFLLQVILGAVLLKTWATWTIVAVTCASLACLSLFYLPLPLPVDHNSGFPSLYVQGLLICFALNAALLVIFISRITRNLRMRDDQLADLRQRSTEEEHIVRMGLLASGAAHELGTPLATLSVILGDWRHMPEFKRNPELQEEIAEMQSQLQRCKRIVSGILLSAGEARGESSTKTMLATFLDELAEEWHTGRAVARFDYDNRIVSDVPVAFDTVLKQTIFNMLDNAHEASPQWLSLTAQLEEHTLIVEVTDAGHGFNEDMLTQLGRPYQSSKGREGSGLGLFLAVNVARTLGGTLTAHNRPEGGAAVKLSLPISAIVLEDQDAHDD
ncbi:MAG TPA: ATP-binding protein [Methylophilaceae bacterium]|nr:ATP-binding protein [Methylophilaceae bacterium]